MEELLKQTGYQLGGLKKGQFVKGKVVLISPQTVLFDIGAKSEAVLASKERNEVSPFLEQLKEGDEVEVLVILPENDFGQPVVSLRKAAADFKWKRAEELLKTKETVVVRGLETNKGGLLVDFLGLRGFIPSSQFSGEHIGKEKDLVGRQLRVKVIEVDRSRNRLVFSEKRVLSPEEEKRRKKLWEKMKIGKKVKGEVTAVLPFGVLLMLTDWKGWFISPRLPGKKLTTPLPIFRKETRLRLWLWEKMRRVSSCNFQLSG